MGMCGVRVFLFSLNSFQWFTAYTHRIDVLLCVLPIIFIERQLFVYFLIIYLYTYLLLLIIVNIIIISTSAVGV